MAKPDDSWSVEANLPIIPEDFDAGDRVYTWDNPELCTFGTVESVTDDEIVILRDDQKRVYLVDDAYGTLEQKSRLWEHGLRLEEVEVGSILSIRVDAKADTVYRRKAKVLEYLPEAKHSAQGILTLKFIEYPYTTHTFTPVWEKCITLEQAMRLWRLEY